MKSSEVQNRLKEWEIEMFGHVQRRDRGRSVLAMQLDVVGVKTKDSEPHREMDKEMDIGL